VEARGITFIRKFAEIGPLVQEEEHTDSTMTSLIRLSLGMESRLKTGYTCLV
jgi:hypothetical protein